MSILCLPVSELAAAAAAADHCVLDRPIVLENVKAATFKVRLEAENVAGVQLPIFKKFGDLSQPSMFKIIVVVLVVVVVVGDQEEDDHQLVMTLL
jgi:vacuolar-type H+-ATPase subunit D/Vma8